MAPRKVSSAPPLLPARTGEGTGAPENAAEPEPVLLEAAGLDDLDDLEEAVFRSRLTTQDAAQAYLYIITKDSKGARLARPIVGANADFIIQAVRRVNAVSKKRIDLRTVDTPPVFQDFTRDGRAWVRCIVGAVDRVSGEISFGIKSEPASSRHTDTLLHSKAIRRAFEVHPSFNRKRVTGIIRDFLLRSGVDPKTVVIAGEGQGNEWSEFFVRARAAGVSGDDLRSQVRDRTGRGLSQVMTPEQAGAAAGAMEETIAQGGPQAVKGDAGRTGAVPGEVGTPAPTPPAADRAGGAPNHGPESSTPDPVVPPAPSPDDPVATTRAACLEYAKRMGLLEKDGSQGPTLRKIWGRVKGDGEPDVRSWRRLFIVLSYVSTGQPLEVAIAEAMATHPAEAASAGGTQKNGRPTDETTTRPAAATVEGAAAEEPAEGSSATPD